MWKVLKNNSARIILPCALKCAIKKEATAASFFIDVFFSEDVQLIV
ncbi:hypothetical protein O59_000321 [Cellvibrio sp. BR]|jgi:hypothetical protein|nr:hypothetical protein O59_000321 [Cellvibrio sp. BR]